MIFQSSACLLSYNRAFARSLSWVPDQELRKPLGVLGDGNTCDSNEVTCDPYVAEGWVKSPGRTQSSIVEDWDFGKA